MTSVRKREKSLSDSREVERNQKISFGGGKSLIAFFLKKIK